MSMAIDSLRGGQIRICFDPSLNVFPNKCRILLEGQMLDTGTATEDELIKIPALRDVDALFGEGSIIAEGLKTAFGCCPNHAMDIYALPRKDADIGATTKAAYTLTFTGPATSDGRVDIFMGDGRWNTSTRVRTGDTAAAIATAVAASINADIGFPFVAVAATGVITLTGKNGGTVLNNLNPVYNWHQRRDYAPAGVTMVSAQTAQGANGTIPDMDYAATLGECCYC